MVNRVGWIRSIPVTVSGADIASVTENPDSRAISGSASATVAAKTGSVASRLAPMPGPLRTLAGEHPHRSTVVLPDRRLIRSVTIGDLSQCLGQLRRVTRHHGRANGPVRTATRQRVSEI